MKKCKFCGASLNDYESICPSCGKSEPTKESLTTSEVLQIKQKIQMLPLNLFFTSFIEQLEILEKCYDDENYSYVNTFLQIFDAKVQSGDEKVKNVLTTHYGNISALIADIKINNDPNHVKTQIFNLTQSLKNIISELNLSYPDIRGNVVFKKQENKNFGDKIWMDVYFKVFSQTIVVALAIMCAVILGIGAIISASTSSWEIMIFPALLVAFIIFAGLYVYASLKKSYKNSICKNCNHVLCDKSNMSYERISLVNKDNGTKATYRVTLKCSKCGNVWSYKCSGYLTLVDTKTGKTTYKTDSEIVESSNALGGFGMKSIKDNSGSFFEKLLNKIILKKVNKKVEKIRQSNFVTTDGSGDIVPKKNKIVFLIIALITSISGLLTGVGAVLSYALNLEKYLAEIATTSFDPQIIKIALVVITAFDFILSLVFAILYNCSGTRKNPLPIIFGSLGLVGSIVQFIPINTPEVEIPPYPTIEKVHGLITQVPSYYEDKAWHGFNFYVANQETLGGTKYWFKAQYNPSEHIFEYELYRDYKFITFYITGIWDVPELPANGTEINSNKLKNESQIYQHYLGANPSEDTCQIRYSQITWIK